jgi:hypothetical protein
MAIATQTASALTIASTQIQTSKIQAVVEFLTELGLPALPVAPSQNSYSSKQHKEVKGDRLKTWPHCPLTKDLKPEPLYTGKNPSFLHSNGKPQLVKHQNYQNRLPTSKEIQTWWENPANGIGTLGGWGGYTWIDFDLKQFESQEECDRAFYGLLDTHPQLRASWWEQTHSGGYRLAVKPRQQPNFTNFTLEPGGKHRGEALGKGRFTVLAPTIGPSGNSYRCINRAIPVEIESLESIGIYPFTKQQERVSKPQRVTPVPGAIALEELGNKTAQSVLRGEDCKGDRSDSLVTAYREWCGWEQWATDNGIALNTTAEELARQAGEALGIDADRVGRIIQKIDPVQCQPAALYCGGEENCWKRVRRLDRATFEAVAPQSIRESLEALYHKKDSGSHPSFNWGGGGNSKPPSHNDGGDGGGELPDDGNPDNLFRQVCTDMGLDFQYCCTRQQFDGFVYRVLFGGETGDWIAINSAFYHWNGKYWEHKTETAINKLIADYGEKAFKISFDRDGTPYITRPYENNKHKESAFKYCRSRLERETLTANAHLLAFNDVTVDLRTGQTMPHKKAFLLTNLIPHDYQPNSECPEVFLNFAIESFGKDQLAKIRAYTSAFLDPTAPYGRFPHLIGQSGGGKGTLGRFWNSLLGENASGSSTAFSDLSTPEGRHQHLTGKRIFGFPDVGGYMQGLRAFYELVDNGPMTGRALFNPVAYQKSWNCRFWIASVLHLQIENAGDGWGRRADPIVALDRVVIPDPDLGAKLQEVKAGVIAWALAMPRAERDAVLLSPPTSTRAKSFVLDAALFGDSTRSFIDLCLRPNSSSTATISHSQLHTWYVAYCQQHGYTPLGQSKFISHLRTVLPRNYAERAWSPQVNGERSRVPAHWKFLAPLTNVFVASSGESTELLNNPQWVCIKARCAEGGIEEFEAYWNPPDIPLSETSEPICSKGVQVVQPHFFEKKEVDNLKSLHGAGVHPGSIVHTKGFDLNSELENQQSLDNQIEKTFLDFHTQDGQNGQGGQADVERVSANLKKLDRADTVDRINRAIEMMKRINSVESFQAFYVLYQRCSQVWQQHIIDSFTAQVSDCSVQEQFYYWWGEFESAGNKEVKPESSEAPVQELVKPVACNKWVRARLAAGSETVVQVLSENSNSLVVHVPGIGRKTIAASQVVRISDYTGD